MCTLTTTGAGEFILLDHHPDLFGQPEAKPGLVEAENRRAALTWRGGCGSGSTSRGPVTMKRPIANLKVCLPST